MPVRGVITQLRNDYSKGQQTYPETVHNSQSLLMAWEGETLPVHRCNKGLSFFNIVNNNDDGEGAAVNGNAQASGVRVSCDGATETCRCYYCKK